MYTVIYFIYVCLAKHLKFSDVLESFPYILKFYEAFPNLPLNQRYLYRNNCHILHIIYTVMMQITT